MVRFGRPKKSKNGYCVVIPVENQRTAQVLLNDIERRFYPIRGYVKELD